MLLWVISYLAQSLRLVGRPLFYLLILLISFFYWTLHKPFLIFSALLLIIGSSWLKNILSDLPRPEDLQSLQLEYSTNIYDRNGHLLYTIYKDKNRKPISMSEIPNRAVLAFLAAEDANFFSHQGISPKGMGRALYKYLRYGEITGGSTITQQLVKNSLLTPERTIKRKVREIILALEIEHKYEKEQILETYLNEVPFGGTVYGIKEASKIYFNKDVSQLTLAEAAYLAGIPQQPTEFNPFGNHPEFTLNRQKEVLNLMVESGFITSDEAQQAKDEPIKLAANQTQIEAPHFVMYVRQLLVDKLGEEMVEKGGLNVITSLDLDLNNQVQKIVTSEVGNLEKLKVGNGAAIVIDPQTGEVLAMIGSKNYFDTTSDGNVNVLTRPRQPGSSIKIVNYSYALEHGYTLSTIIDDSPVSFPIAGHAPYAPKNYDNKYRGKMTLRDALAQSRNIPAVKILNSYGVDKMISLGTALGITTWTNPNRFGLALTLGAGEIHITDLATVYGTVANYGKKITLNPILKITDRYGNEIKLNSSQYNNQQILQPTTAYLLIDTLKDNNARAPAFGPNSLLNIKGHPEVAVKTGTSNFLRDNMAIGFNQNFLVAAWVGNNDNTPMSAIASGMTGATPIWNKIMLLLLENKESKPWEVPEGLVQASVCTLTGTLTCNGCSSKTEWFVQGTQPQYACNKDQFISKEKKGKEQS